MCWDIAVKDKNAIRNDLCVILNDGIKNQTVIRNTAGKYLEEN